MLFDFVGLLSHIRKSLEHSSYFEELLLCSSSKDGQTDTLDDLFELVVPVSLSLICFRLKNANEAKQQLLLNNIKLSGDCFIIHTKLDGRIVLRVACGGIEQSRDDILHAYTIILREAKKIMEL